MKNKVDMDKEMEELAKVLKGNAIFEENEKKLLSRIYVPSEATAIKARRSIQNIISILNEDGIRSMSSEQVIEKLKTNNLRNTWSYIDIYLKTIRKLNSKYKTSLTTKARKLLFVKTEQLNKEYLRRLSAIHNSTILPTFLSKDFHDRGWLIMYPDELRRNGEFYLVKKTEFQLKKFCGEEGMVNKLPSVHRKKIPCYLGFILKYNNGSKEVRRIVALAKDGSGLNSFHVNAGSICLGAMHHLISIANDGIRSDNLNKLDQVVKDLIEMLSIINMGSAYETGEDMRSVRRYVQKKLREAQAKRVSRRRRRRDERGAAIIREIRESAVREVSPLDQIPNITYDYVSGVPSGTTTTSNQ